MAGHKVQHNDVSDIEVIRSFACQYAEKDPNAQGRFKERCCWICFQNSSENRLASWLHPCKCKGATKWVHNECLSRWMDEKQAENSFKSISCPHCKTKYKFMISSIGIIAIFLERCNLFWEGCSQLFAVACAFAALYHCCIVYGIITIVQTLKPEQGLYLLDNINLSLSLIFLPIIPIILVFGRMIQWENYVIRILYSRKFFKRIPLLNYLIAYSNDDDSLRAPELAFVDTLDVGRVLCGGILLPIFAYFAGYIFYRSVENNLWRVILGGLTVIIVKGILKIFLKKQKLMALKSRIILDYTKENIEKCGILLADNNGVPTAAI